ncbi:MAG: pyridoxamine 5'-phosphate oxidase family protein, partial [Streptosporangiaceae bacterium]
MATVYPELDERLIAFIKNQPMFFVATAPCLDQAGDGGHVNLSPKGYRDTFAVLDPLTVAYLDLTGSGAETIAHLRQNGRIVVMFCSFTRNSRIMRLHGHGRVLRADDPEFAALAPHFNLAHPGLRSIIL